MIREVTLKPANTISSYASYVNPATSPYPWLGSGSTTPHEAWSENGETATNPASSEKWAYEWGGHGAEHIVTFEPAPTLCLFTKVTIRAKFDTMQTGPNNWYYPPDNEYGPGIRFVLRNRAKDDYHYGGAGWSLGEDYTGTGGPDLTDVDAYNNRPSEGDIWALTPWLEYEWTSHPEGGPFTLEDINNLACGVRFLTSNGPSGKPYDFTQGSFFKIRVPIFIVTLTVQDLGGYVRSVRHNASATLRMKRRARNTVKLTVPADRIKKDVGDVAHLAHDRGPGSAGEGWGRKPLERRNVYITERVYWPEAMKVEDIGYDLHDFSCEAWGSFMIPIAWTPELSGMAYLDQGGEWTMTRAQDAWSMRPGDGVALRVLDDYPNLSEEGLALHSANGEEILSYNANLGNAAWGEATSDATFTAETELPMADELGYTDSERLTFGGTPGTAHKSRTFSLTSGDTLSLRVRCRNISNDDPEAKFLEVQLKNPDDEYWDEANRAWSAVAVNNPIPATGGFGEIVCDQIPITATGTHTLIIGRITSTINTAEFVVALVSAQKNADGCGMPLVTLGSPITRVADVFEMDNASPHTVWHLDRGTAVFEFRPFWRADSLAAATEKVIAQAVHSDGATDTVYFTSDTTDKLVFDRFDGNVTTQTVLVDLLDANGDPLKLTREHIVRVYVRWLDSNGWRQFAPYEAAIGYAVFTVSPRAFVSQGEARTVWTAPAAVTEDTFKLSGLDGWMRFFEIKHVPLEGSEAVWRR